MSRKDPPLQVELPRAVDDKPVWSRVGLIAAAGFVLGVAWPHLAGVRLGPNPPSDARPAIADTAAPATAAPTAAPSVVAAVPSAAPSAEPASNQQLVVVGPGTIQRCFDAKRKRLDDCGELEFDPIATPRLQALANCPSALGLEGQLSIGFDIDFKKKQVHVAKGKKTTLPSSTVQGVLQCAAREFANVELTDVPHEHPRYSLLYTATFHPPGKHPTAAVAPANGEGPAEKQGDAGDAAGTTTSEASASGTATVRWDTALIRKEPKDGGIAARAVRGTRLTIVGRRGDWYRVEVGKKTGWVYRGAIGL
jgi:hypothetical protein